MKKIERRFLPAVEMTETLNNQQKKVFSILFKQKTTPHISLLVKEALHVSLEKSTGNYIKN